MEARSLVIELPSSSLEPVGNPEHVVHIEYNALWSVEEIEKNIEVLSRSGVFAGIEEKLK